MPFKMKILFLTHEDINKTAVAKAMFFDTAVALKHKYKISFLSASEVNSNEVETINGIEMHTFERRAQGRISILDILNLIKNIKKIKNLCDSNDVLYFRSYPMLILMYFPLMFSRKKIIFDTRGVFFEELFDSGKVKSRNITKKIFRYIEKLLLKVSTVVLCVSEAQMNYYKKLVDKSCYKVIYNASGKGVSKVGFINGSHLTIGYVGSLVQWHMPERISDILEIMQRKGMNFEFHCLTRDLENANDIFSNIKNAKIYSCNYRETPIKFDLGLCLIKDSISKRVCFPVKYAEYLSANTDVVFSSNIDVCNKFHNDYGIGKSINLEDSNEKIAEDIIEYMNNNMNNDVKLPEVLRFEYSINSIIDVIESLRR